MESSGFLVVVLNGAAVIAISVVLDCIWSAALPPGLIYYFIRAPGVIFHECAHILGCIITGARVQQVVFFSRDGGSVIYTRPIIPYLGDIIISTAPLFFIPIVLSAITLIFTTYLGCTFTDFPRQIDSPAMLAAAGDAIMRTFRINLVTQFNGWFLLYLYITLSLVLSVAPSRQDMKNAAAGIFLMILVGFVIIRTGNTVALNLLSGFAEILEIGLIPGLEFGLIALLLSSPLVLWYGYCRNA